jgi:methane/ammonia monooxygenase subunit C
MAATTESVKADAAEAPLLNKRNLTLGIMLYLVFYSFIRWYEGVYGWSAGLDSFAPEFETYWMNMLYIEIVARSCCSQVSTVTSGKLVIVKLCQSLHVKN